MLCPACCVASIGDRQSLPRDIPSQREELHVLFPLERRGQVISPLGESIRGSASQLLWDLGPSVTLAEHVHLLHKRFGTSDKAIASGSRLNYGQV